MRPLRRGPACRRLLFQRLIERNAQSGGIAQQDAAVFDPLIDVEPFRKSKILDFAAQMIRDSGRRVRDWIGIIANGAYR